MPEGCTVSPDRATLFVASEPLSWGRFSPAAGAVAVAASVAGDATTPEGEAAPAGAVAGVAEGAVAAVAAGASGLSPSAGGALAATEATPST